MTRIAILAIAVAAALTGCQPANTAADKARCRSAAHSVAERLAKGQVTDRHAQSEINAACGGVDAATQKEIVAEERMNVTGK